MSNFQFIASGLAIITCFIILIIYALHMVLPEAYQ